MDHLSQILRDHRNEENSCIPLMVAADEWRHVISEAYGNNLRYKSRKMYSNTGTVIKSWDEFSLPDTHPDRSSGTNETYYHWEELI